MICSEGEVSRSQLISLPLGYGPFTDIWNMHSIRSRLPSPVQIFLIVFYIVLVLFIKTMYDNHQRSHRYEKYNEILQDVVRTLEEVEKQAKKSINTYDMVDDLRNINEEAKYIKSILHLENNPTSKPS